MLVSSGAMRWLSDDQFEVLNGVALCQAPDAATVADAVGIDETIVAAEVRSAVERGDLLRIRRSMMVSESGQELLADEYARRYRSIREDASFERALDRFEAINKQQLQEAMSDWQTVAVSGIRMPNEHVDQDYDEAVIGRIGDIVDGVKRVLEPFSGTEPRIGRSCERLWTAVNRAQLGETEYVSGSLVPSARIVWSQLHKDLLRLTRRERDG